jgi:hypothetical protein
MLISHSHSFIYAKTMKTAGTSVEIYFEGACLPPASNVVRGHAIEETVTAVGIIGHRGGEKTGLTWYNHMSAETILDQVGVRIWDRYFKFCVIRNPFDKLVSYWWMFVTPQDRERYKGADFSEIRADFSRWVAAHGSLVEDRHTYLIDGAPCMDFFIRYDRLLEEIEWVCSQIDYPYLPELLGSYKSNLRTNKRSFREYYEPAALIAVENAFGWELEYFGYSLA